MADYDDVPYIVIERSEGGTGPFVWGALLGAAAALLLAPRSGQETQAEIRRSTLQLRDRAEGRLGEVRGAVTDAVQRTRDRVSEQVASVRDTIDSRADQARHAMEAGRDAARDARQQLERRVAEAKNAVGGMAAATADMQPPLEVDLVITEVTVEEDVGDLPMR
jgi:gas vesicle protein